MVTAKKNFEFELLAQCPVTGARAGQFLTPHGIVETPRFMPVGTLANVKTVTTAQLKETGAQMVLSNTYHLHLQPGEDLVQKAGGLHKFMGWSGPMLTDSGGFQVFSLSKMRTITDEGVTFRSPRDGAIINLTPEKSIEIQNALGADVIMAFDECAPSGCGRDVTEKALVRTTEWLKRCVSAHKREDQALFGIVQGGEFLDLRSESARQLVALDLPGYAIGGVSVGESPEMIDRVVQHTAPQLPHNKLRYLMGVGTKREMARAISAGIDVFDCVIPTRLARHGNAITGSHRWNIKNTQFREDFRPIDPTCSCYTCTNFSRAYLGHLFRAQEVLAYTLLSIHNITELVRFTQEIRRSILDGTFATEFADWIIPVES